MRLHQPVVAELRRHMEGWRKTEALAEEICEALAEADPAREPRLRVVAAGLIAAELDGAEVGREFDEDWASCLLLGALQSLRMTHPRPHSLLLRTYDRPEGRAPFSPSELALKLAHPLSEVEHDLHEGRVELQRLFKQQVVRTLADPDAADEEFALLEPYAHAAFDMG
ncbi:MAG: hypothetical protein ACYTGN_02885 [Planctomycetota bacterium]|jgi:hypothetical protein